MNTNALEYAKKMEEVGFTSEQAEMTVGIMNEVIESNLATRDDIQRLDSLFRYEMKELRFELIINMGAIMVTGIAVISALVKFI